MKIYQIAFFAWRNKPVFKHGTATGLTDGEVLAHGFVQITSAHGTMDFDADVVECMECFVVQPKSFDVFARSGDSGSLVFTLEMNEQQQSVSATAVGMVCAGSDELYRSKDKTAKLTVACFIEDVLHGLGAKMVFNNSPPHQVQPQ